MKIKAEPIRSLLIVITGLLICFALTPAAYGQTKNLALGQYATQSSTAFSSPASWAVDGSTNGAWGGNSLTHTDYNYQAWWQVDLGAIFLLDQIKIWNRTDCCGDRLSNFYVLVSDEPFASNDLYTAMAQQGVSSYYVAGQAGSPTTVLAGRTGRYVRVQLTGTNYLSLAEVEVWEDVTTTKEASLTNVALAANGGTAYASSTHSSGFGAQYVIDGSRTGAPWGFGGGWNDGTSNAWPDWIEIHFNGSKSIDVVNVFSVQDTYWSPTEPTPWQTFSLYGLVDFRVQYWNGSAWVDVPGGAVINNNLVWRQISFSPVVTNRIRVYVTRALDTWTRITEVEAFTSEASYEVAAKGGCIRPELLEKEILAALQNMGSAEAGTLFREGGPASDPRYPARWKRCLNPTFSNWKRNGSQNLPVMSAAIGLSRQPTARMTNPGDLSLSPTKYTEWWINYLGYQTREIPVPDCPTGPNVPLPPKCNKRLGHFKGSEPFSSIYDGSVVSSIVAVRYWAWKNLNNSNVEIKRAAERIDAYAQKYLRANWLLYGLAAGKRAALSYDLPGRTASATPLPDTGYNPNAPLINGVPRYGGRFLALAGARSNLDFWFDGDRSALFERALEEYPPPAPSRTNEDESQKLLLNHMETDWRSAVPSTQRNLYGLYQSERDNLRNLVNNGDLSAFKTSDNKFPWLSKIRTNVTFRFLGWLVNLNQVRATMMTTNPNANTPPMLAVKYDDSSRVATFLYPWSDRKGPFKGGVSQLLLGSIKANNFPGVPNPAFDRTRPESTDNPKFLHPPKEVTMATPATNPLFHIVLSEYEEAYLDTSASSTFPPREPLTSWPYDAPYDDLNPPEDPPGN